MSACEHDLAEAETMCADGFCPMCCQIKIASLETRLLAYQKLKEEAMRGIKSGYWDSSLMLALENIDRLESGGK